MFSFDGVTLEKRKRAERNAEQLCRDAIPQNETIDLKSWINMVINGCTTTASFHTMKQKHWLVLTTAPQRAAQSAY